MDDFPSLPKGQDHLSFYLVLKQILQFVSLAKNKKDVYTEIFRLEVALTLRNPIFG